MNKLNSTIRSYKLISKSLYLRKDKYDKDYENSLSVKKDYEKKLKEAYNAIKNCPKKTYNKILKILEFDKNRKNALNEALKKIEKFLIK